YDKAPEDPLLRRTLVAAVKLNGFRHGQRTRRKQPRIVDQGLDKRAAGRHLSPIIAAWMTASSLLAEESSAWRPHGASGSVYPGRGCQYLDRNPPFGG